MDTSVIIVWSITETGKAEKIFNQIKRERERKNKRGGREMRSRRLPATFEQPAIGMYGEDVRSIIARPEACSAVRFVTMV